MANLGRSRARFTKLAKSCSNLADLGLNPTKFDKFGPGSTKFVPTSAGFDRLKPCSGQTQQEFGKI